MTYNYSTTPTLSDISLNTTSWKVMLTSVTNTYAGVYNITIYAYDGTYPLPGEFTYTIEIINYLILYKLISIIIETSI